MKRMCDWLPTKTADTQAIFFTAEEIVEAVCETKIWPPPPNIQEVVVYDQDTIWTKQKNNTENYRPKKALS